MYSKKRNIKRREIKRKNVSLRMTIVKKCREFSQTRFMGKQLNVRGLLYHAIEGTNRDAIEHEVGHELTSVARECSGQTSVQSSLFVTEIACLSRQRTQLLTQKSLREFPWFFFMIAVRMVLYVFVSQYLEN